MDAKRPILVVPDLQIPFEHKDALAFCKYLKTHFSIPSENVLCVGDELDCYHGGKWPKDADGKYSATGEIAVAREKLKEWAQIFPEMKLAISNHGLRWVKKATAAEIPSQILRSYEQIFDMPKRWKWQYEWLFNKLKYPFRMIHGMEYAGKDGARNAAMDAKISTVIGHIHCHAGVSHMKMLGMPQRIFGFNVGSLIDVEQYAFEYEKRNRAKPCLGAGVILDSGKTPVWMPLD